MCTLYFVFIINTYNIAISPFRDWSVQNTRWQSYCT